MSNSEGKGSIATDKKTIEENVEEGGHEGGHEQSSFEASASRRISYNKKDSGSKMASFKLLLLVMMVLQNSFTVLVGRYTRSAVAKDQQYEVSHLILICEFAKLVLSCVLEFWTTRGKFLESLHTHVFSRPLDALKIMVPALLYLVQNTLLYVALSNLTAPIFQVSYQSKLVTTAIVSVFMLQRQYNVRQWICLVGISIGVAIVILGERQAEDEEKDKLKATNLGVGLAAISIACMSSALAGVYFEKVLKNPSDDKAPNASVWMRNMQLAFFSVIIAACEGGTEHSGKPYFHGFDGWVWVLVALQSGGGLLVAAVIKYADNVLKGLATGVSVVLSSGLSMVIFATPLGPKFFVGGIMILLSVWFFSNPFPLWLSSKLKSESEMSSLLPK